MVHKNTIFNVFVIMRLFLDLSPSPISIISITFALTHPIAYAWFVHFKNQSQVRACC